MTVHSTTRAAEPISSTEKEQIDALRARLNECLKKIPEDLDTDLNLVRWIRGYQAFDQNFSKDYGTSGIPYPFRYFEMPAIKPFLPFIASSRLGDSVWSEEHNAFMFVERAWAQPREVSMDSGRYRSTETESYRNPRPCSS
ncbi:hypothetical protein ANCDUO_17071 [Ancylostoma duodenale]|uniref:Uncharacterized protein n=1 Tax=Ancylostoma duodenale TaxID=51022 RepID=A0A0C2G1K5_9BILA|nr:hypothetical protein ANCDUO_17071 [Ancylostoma duodenale]